LKEEKMRWFFSGKGDEGKSSLMDGISLAKNDVAFELIGTLDELNAALGLAMSFCEDETINADLLFLQKNNSALMGVVAGFPLAANGSKPGLAEFLEWIEERVKYYGGDVNNPRQFVFPGNTSLGAALDLARTIVRRAERRAVDYREANPNLDQGVMAVLNRLSSLFFLMRLFVDQS
jgi:cob(I)alamin adenosyltransferase